MRKLILGVIAAVALAVPAAPAFAIHDPNIPAGVCSNPASEAVGHPATGKANTAFSNTVLQVRNNANPHCALAP